MRLWFDANALFRKPAELREISELARSRGVTPAICAQVYLERRHQRHMQVLSKGLEFDPVLFDGYYTAMFDLIEISLDRRTAGRWADKLAGRYHSRSEWRAATLATLGGQLKAEFKDSPSRVPMTTDWWIALQAEDDPLDYVVCHESGEEWRRLRDQKRIFTWDQAQDWLKAHPLSSR